LHLSQEVIIILTLSADYAVFDHLDNCRSFLQRADVRTANDSSNAARKKSHDGVVALMTQDIAGLKPGASLATSMNIRDLEVCNLASIEAAPP
jgi:hypothetical protein